MKVIVTGFNAFGDSQMNPSQEAVNELPDFVKNENKAQAHQIVKLTLETCCDSAWEEVKKEVENSSERFLLLMSGVAGGRDKICLERFALNVRQYRIPDNNQHSWDHDHIVEGAPDAIRSKLPLRKLLDHLNRMNYACDISNHAGSYVCNETYFRALNEWQESDRCHGILFVHVPDYEKYSHTNTEIKDERPRRETYAACLQDAIKFLVD